MDPTLFRSLVLGWIVIGILVLPLTIAITAPFGRHANNRFGPSMSNRVGWIIMESPAIWWFSLVFCSGLFGESPTPVAWIPWALWMLHYVNRALIFPFRTRTAKKKIPLVIVGFAFSFQMVNGYFNGMALGPFSGDYTASWLLTPQFIIGLGLFVVGWQINIRSDERLLNLRRPNESSYQIPRGGLFRWISCPNFLGEIILWCGWALLCGNLAALSFAVWTIANLVPRALAHHRWYLHHFEDYPSNRKAIIPGIL